MDSFAVVGVEVAVVMPMGILGSSFFILFLGGVERALTLSVEIEVGFGSSIVIFFIR